MMTSWLRRTQSLMRPERIRRHKRASLVAINDHHNVDNDVGNEDNVGKEGDRDKLEMCKKSRLKRAQSFMEPLRDECSESSKAQRRRRSFIRRLSSFKRHGRLRMASRSSCEALKAAVAELYNLDDFERTQIGEGFFALVYKVVHKTSGRVLVLKLNKSSANRRTTLNEVQIMNTLSHENILRYEAACVHEGQLHALTEFANGGSLEQLIQKSIQDFPFALRAKLALDVAKGMQYLHKKGLFHRDLTSKNVLIRINESDKELDTADDHVELDKVLNSMTAVVADFGLATRQPRRHEILDHVGSPFYMSPECLRGLHYDHKSDVFAFGIVLCELAARVEADPDQLARTSNFGVDYLALANIVEASCPHQLLEIAFQCVQIDPEKRPDFEQIVQKLQHLLDELAQASNKGTDITFDATKSESFSNESDFKSDEKDQQNVVLSRCALLARQMSELDPHYSPSRDPFSAILAAHILEAGLNRAKVIGPKDLCHSCFSINTRNDNKKRPMRKANSFAIYNSSNSHVDSNNDFCKEVRERLSVVEQGHSR